MPKSNKSKVSNTKTIVAPKGDEPMSLDQLLDLFDVDQEIWKVDSFEPNSWPIGVKIEEKDITFVDGVMNGYVKSDGGINTKRLYQSKAVLSRKILMPSKVPIHHVSVSLRKSKTIKQKQNNKLKNALFLPDPQFGFLKAINKSGAVPIHDRIAIDAVRQVVLNLDRLDTIVWIGDILDLSEWSTHFVLRPEFQMTTQAALIEAAWTIGSFVCDFQNADHVVMLGNHDDRLEQFMIRNMKQAYMIKPADQLELNSIMSVDNLLGLNRIGVKYIGNYPDGELWLNPNLKSIHGSIARARPGSTATAVIDGAIINQMFGHIHRQEIVSQRISAYNDDRQIWAASPGCLCHLDGRVPGSSKDRNWQKGAALVQYDDEGFVSFPEFITIHGENAFFRGSRFKGLDRFEDIISSTKGNFDWRSYETLELNAL